MDTDIEVEGAAPDAEALDQTAGSQEQQTQEPRDEFGERATKRINKLVGRAKAAEEAAERARRRTEELERELASERQRARQATEAGHGFAEQNLTAALDRAKADIRRAIAEGDADAQADAVERLADAKAELKALKSGRVEQPRTEQPAQPRQPAPQASARAQVWVADNPWFVQDAAKRTRALAIHEELMAEGVDPNSSRYYTLITERTRDLANDDEDDDAPPPAPRPAAGSGVTRTAAPAARPGATKIKLSAEQVETARELGMTVEAYAAEVARLQRNGAFDRSNKR